MCIYICVSYERPTAVVFNDPIIICFYIKTINRARSVSGRSVVKGTYYVLIVGFLDTKGGKKKKKKL